MSVPRAVLTLACAAAAALAIASTPVHGDCTAPLGHWADVCEVCEVCVDVCEDVDGWVDKYGYDCAYWGKDMNGDGFPDFPDSERCHLSEIDYLYDNMDLPDIVKNNILEYDYYGATKWWQTDIRTNCPKACGVCIAPDDDQEEGDEEKKKTCKPIPCKKKKAKALAKACKKTLKSKKCKKAIKKAPECLYEYLA